MKGTAYMSNGNHKPRNRSVSEQSAEARGQSKRVSLKFRGHTYHIDDPDNWSIDALEHMAEAEDKPQKAILFVRELLGNQWQPFKDRHNTSGALSEFMEKVMNRINEQSGDGSPN